MRSADFFDAEHYGDITFKSTRIEHAEGVMLRVVGDLTIRDETHAISLATVVQAPARTRGPASASASRRAP